MNRSQFLREVGDTLTKREHTYGHPSNNLRAIAKTWSEYKGQDFNYLDVCIMMILTKAMRLKEDPIHVDSYKDIAGYSALAVELISTLVQNGDHPEKVDELENGEDQCMSS